MGGLGKYVTCHISEFLFFLLYRQDFQHVDQLKQVLSDPTSPGAIKGSLGRLLVFMAHGRQRAGWCPCSNLAIFVSDLMAWTVVQCVSVRVVLFVSYSSSLLNVFSVDW